jgi:hypothetical protein
MDSEACLDESHPTHGLTRQEEKVRGYRDKLNVHTSYILSIIWPVSLSTAFLLSHLPELLIIAVESMDGAR